VSSISVFAPYSALILSIVLVVLFLIRFYILQRFLLRKLYGSKYTQLNDVEQRSFINHHIAGATNLLFSSWLPTPLVLWLSREWAFMPHTSTGPM